MTRTFPLIKKPLFPLLCALLLLFSFGCSLLFTPSPKAPVHSFDQDLPMLEKALAEAKEKAATQGEALFRQEILFYESALRLSLSPYSSYFASEGLSLYAYLAANKRQEEAAALESILVNKDEDAFAAFLDSMREKDGVAQDERERLAQRDHLLLSAPFPFHTGQSALLYQITLLEDSLEENKDYYFGDEKALSDHKVRLFTSLLESKKELLLHEEIDPVPANAETLRSCGRFLSLLLSLLILLVIATGAEEKKGLSSLLPLLAIALALALLSAAALSLALLWRAPLALQQTLVPVFGSVVAVPFFPAFFTSLFLHFLSDAPWLLFCFYWKTRGTLGMKAKLFAFLPLLRFLLFSALPFLPKAVAPFLSLTDLSEALLPELAPFATVPFSPFLTVLLRATLILLALFLFLRERKKADRP